MMEHPLRVDEFSPSEMPQRLAAGPAAPEVPFSATAAATQYCIQYFSSWTRAADTAAHLAQVAKVHAAMRPHMPGAAYVNYCDLDLPDYATAYWGDNPPA